MRLSALLTLPPALLGVCLEYALAQEIPWPYNLPAHVKYYPEDEQFIRRNLDVSQRLSFQSPVGVKKMSDDPGEKFFPEYWQFNDRHYIYSNVSIPLDAPLRPHGLSLPKRSIPWMFRSVDKRDFECPAGSRACTEINEPDSCCEIGSTCQIIEDVGLGNVGCCPSNEVCGGSVNSCPQDYTSCPNQADGQDNGCCLPGYACFEQGCVMTSTATVVLTPTSTSTSIISSVSTVTTPIPLPQPATSSTETSTTSSSTITSPPSTSSAVNSLTCSSGFKSCPASLGGGCCPTSRACGSHVCPALSSTASFSAPARPTSITATTTNGFTSIPGICPTGFYACEAYYQGGCCQTGRNCDTTSCPSTASITVVDGSVTAVAPTGSGITSVPMSLTGACASGWQSCAQSFGGGCCPNGYACGTSCTASITGGQAATLGRIAPNAATRLNGAVWAIALFVVL